MSRSLPVLLLLCFSLASAGSETEKKPYVSLSQRPYEYHGPRREDPEPTDLEAVRIGLFVPQSGPGLRHGTEMRRGAKLAIELANREGGYQGLPFALVTRPADSTWGSAREMVGLVYDDEVWAVLGSLGGESTHVAEQIITKAQVPLVGPASTDSSLTQINIPWVFRLMPSDEALVDVLARHLFRDRGFLRVVSFASPGFDHRWRSRELATAARRRGHPLLLEAELASGPDPISRHLSTLRGLGAEAVVVWADKNDTMAAVRAIKEALPTAGLFAGPDPALSPWLTPSQSPPDGLVVVAPACVEAGNSVLASFRNAYLERHDKPPSVLAAYAYDGMRLIIGAVGVGGLNRAKIRDALAELSPVSGASGEIRFDGTGSNITPPLLFVVRNGRFSRLDR